MSDMTPTVLECSGTTLLEPSFSDLVAAIDGAADLSQQRRQHWLCSVRQLAKWLDRPIEVVPARWQAIRHSVGHLHHARIGVTPKTLANHKATRGPHCVGLPKSRACRSTGGACRRSGRDC